MHSQVEAALEFGRDHLGSAMSESKGGALTTLLNSSEARLLMHTAAKNGEADIVHEYIKSGAPVNAQDKDGNTPLHLAMFHGHERTAWAIIDAGKPDIDIENMAGQTALVMGYLMLWQRPPESAVRAVSTLAQVRNFNA